MTEILLTAFSLAIWGTMDVAELIEIERGNAHIADDLATENSYTSTLFPHPYLGFVHNERLRGVNNIGLIGRDVPLRRDPDRFTILLIGGSVAAQLGTAGEDGLGYLESMLEAAYDFGGRRVTVLTGAAGGWKQPQPAIMLMLYGEVADAVISLEGFNEHYALGEGTPRIEFPASNFDLMNPLASHGFDGLIAAARSADSRRSARRVGLRTWYFWTRLQRRWIREGLPAPSTDRTTTASLFALPADWSAAQRASFNLDQYAKYLRLTQAMADRLGIPSAFFIQPVPALHKTLTDEERGRVGDLGYADRYRTLERSLLELRKEGLEVISLLRVFEHVEEDLYSDAIHCHWSIPARGTWSPSKGYRLMSESITLALGEAWGLAPRP